MRLTDLLPLLLLCLAGAVLASPVAISRRAEHGPTTVALDRSIYDAIDKAFQDAVSAAPTLTTRASGDTRNDLIEGKCGGVVVIFARGTYGSFRAPPPRVHPY